MIVPSQATFFIGSSGQLKIGAAVCTSGPARPSPRRNSARLAQAAVWCWQHAPKRAVPRNYLCAWLCFWIKRETARHCVLHRPCALWRLLPSFCVGRVEETRGVASAMHAVGAFYPASVWAGLRRPGARHRPCTLWAPSTQLLCRQGLRRTPGARPIQPAKQRHRVLVDTSEDVKRLGRLAASRFAVVAVADIADRTAGFGGATAERRHRPPKLTVPLEAIGHAAPYGVAAAAARASVRVRDAREQLGGS
eukprot:366568-Chlamydomonas_euryale.AAC.9